MRRFIYGSALVLSALTIHSGLMLAQEATPEATAEAAITAPATTSDNAIVTTKTWLGLAIQTVAGKVTVAQIEVGSPAETAGLQVDDVIVSFNGTALTSNRELRDLVRAAEAGSVATLEVQRGTETLSVDVTLGSKEATGGQGGRGGRGDKGQGWDDQANALTGIDLAERLLDADLEAADGGYSVVTVSENHNLFGLAVGDIITAVNGQDITTVDVTALHETLLAQGTPSVTLSVIRDGAATDLTAELMPGLPGFGRGQGHSGMGGAGRGEGHGGGHGHGGGMGQGQGGNGGGMGQGQGGGRGNGQGQGNSNGNSSGNGGSV